MKIEPNNQSAQNWYKHPSRVHVIIVMTAWLIGNGLLLLAITDLFTQDFIGKKYLVVYMMMVGSTLSTAHFVRNYLRTRLR